VFLDSDSVKSFLTANIRKPYPSIISLNRKGERTTLEDLNPHNIDTAAQTPTGMQFAFKSGQNNKFYTFDMAKNEIKLLKDFESERKAIRPEPVALAMPEANVVYAVWRRDAKIVFKRIRIGITTPEIHEEDLRDVYDRC
jgi:hypothetical protein